MRHTDYTGVEIGGDVTGAPTCAILLESFSVFQLQTAPCTDL